MRQTLAFILLLALTGSAGSQVDPAKIAAVYQQQRNITADSLAQCAVTVGDLQARIAELEKKLSEAGK